MNISKLFRRLSQVSDSCPYEHIRDVEEQPEAPRGYVPVYVGDEMERFTVPAKLLGHPVFVRLLQLSAQEYGYRQCGALQIPCSVPVFRSVLSSLRGTGGCRQGFSGVNEKEIILSFSES